MMFHPESQPDWQLSKERIDIWLLPLHHDIPALQNCLNHDEIERANRFHFQQHRRRFRVARSLLRHILSSYLQSTPQSIEFCYQSHGKPTIQSNLPIQFNLSHTGDIGCLAIGSHWQLGVDVERYSTRDYQGIGSHVFSDTEQKHLKALPGFLLPMAFFSLWSAKEAVIKCNGKGMSYPLKTLTLPIFSQQSHNFVDTDTRKTQQLIRFSPQAGVAGALCCHPQIQSIRFYKWSPFFSQ